MKNASESDEGRASNEGSAPLAREQAACECPARKALVKIRRTPAMPFPDPGAHSLHAFAGSVHRAWCEIQNTVTSALAVPCPCEAEKRINFDAALRYQARALQAESDLAEALDVLKPFAEAWANRRPSFDDKHLFSIVCLPEERLTFDRIVALFTNVSTRASGEPARMEARASQDCPIPKEIL